MNTSSSGSLPSDRHGQQYVSVVPLLCGSITLPEKSFVSDANLDKKQTVPSMAFLATHPGPVAASGVNQVTKKKPFRILFDLGLRNCVKDYSSAVQKHLQNRQPYTLGQGAAAQLEAGGLYPDDIDMVILSHVHYDHHGDPAAFQKSTFVVSNRSLQLLEKGLEGLGSHQHFDPDLLPLDRTVELSSAAVGSSWEPIGPFDASLDLFGDGTIYIVDAPGQLPGHINLLCRTGPGKFICLCGDAFHDKCLLTAEHDFAYWENDDGHRLCIHTDPVRAQQTLKKLKILCDWGVDVVAAHDHDWLRRYQKAAFPNAK
ncbi:hypothetical protein H2198_006284 [Neophaeococcomyces mojaviensis]|uniref:Uncharacterized protein n=1 Tax=Neophaeococcomyces mojaviensis TaxID=3383035 RepID=A0ACC3A3B5_9EURO|nr:hypothetical protein H2198_006284 [Knufia sp. JES_112]